MADKRIVSKITKSARGQACTIRLEGCYGGPNNENVVFCHINGGGMGMKALDIHGAYGCFLDNIGFVIATLFQVISYL